MAIFKSQLTRKGAGHRTLRRRLPSSPTEKGICDYGSFATVYAADLRLHPAATPPSTPTSDTQRKVSLKENRKTKESGKDAEEGQRSLEGCEPESTKERCKPSAELGLETSRVMFRRESPILLERAAQIKRGNFYEEMLSGASSHCSNNSTSRLQGLLHPADALPRCCCLAEGVAEARDQLCRIFDELCLDVRGMVCCAADLVPISIVTEVLNKLRDTLRHGPQPGSKRSSVVSMESVFSQCSSD